MLFLDSYLIPSWFKSLNLRESPTIEFSLSCYESERVDKLELPYVTLFLEKD